MDRHKAEQLLRATNNIGSYLIRESERKKDSFVLSFLGLTGINHFCINSYCGDYYIAGLQFPSLRHLIAYYTNYCDLLKRERLLYPVPPQEVDFKASPFINLS